jgi:hypothetical protein
MARSRPEDTERIHACMRFEYFFRLSYPLARAKKEILFSHSNALAPGKKCN